MTGVLRRRRNVHPERRITCEDRGESWGGVAISKEPQATRR